MTGPDFIAWQGRLGLSIDDAARVLDVSRRTITNIRARGTPVPFATELACRWLEDHPGFVADYLAASRHADIFA